MLARSLLEFARNRHQAAWEGYSKTREYANLNDAAEASYEAFRATLTDEQQELFLAYDDAHSSLVAYQKTEKYAQGLKDGFALREYLASDITLTEYEKESAAAGTNSTL